MVITFYFYDFTECTPGISIYVSRHCSSVNCRNYGSLKCVAHIIIVQLQKI